MKCTSIFLLLADRGNRYSCKFYKALDYTWSNLGSRAYNIFDSYSCLDFSFRCELTSCNRLTSCIDPKNLIVLCKTSRSWAVRGFSKATFISTLISYFNSSDIYLLSFFARQILRFQVYTFLATSNRNNQPMKGTVICALIVWVLVNANDFSSIFVNHVLFFLRNE